MLKKCFDSIWHEGLFFKLIMALPRSHWAFLYQLYKSMRCVVRWGNTYSKSFMVKRGTKQGSIISPTLFNIFINDLLDELSKSKAGLRIDDDVFYSFAYADDVNLFSLSTSELQALINICYRYSKTWRFTFGIKKTYCMTSGKNPFKTDPCWIIG